MNKFIFILFLITFSLFASCQSQKKEITKNERIDLLKQIWNIVNENFYDPNFQAVDWEKKYSEYKEEIEVCNNTDSLFLLLNKMLFTLNSSHCGVGRLSEIDKALSPYIFGNGETGIDIRIIENQIIVTKVLANSSAEKAGIKTGFVIEKIDSFTLNDIKKLVKYKPPFNDRNKKYHQTIEVLRYIYGQSGTTVRIEFFDENNKTYTRTLTRTKRQNGIVINNGMPLSYLKSESYFISDDIAYLSFNAFNIADFENLLNCFDEVRKSKNLIIDLRGNDGGSIEVMKLLLGRFVSERKKYGTYINRAEQNEDFIEPIGKKYQGKVVLLIDEMSISGAENMAGIIQQFEIGKVIGNRSPGQMLWGNFYIINDSIALVVPLYKLEYPNGYNIENLGIIPDIEIKLKQTDLLKGIDTQLEKAIEYFNLSK